MRPVNKIIVHCAYTPPGMDIGVDEIRDWHKSRGWDDVGYHYVIRRNGVTEPGREERVVGAHAFGHNGDSLGVCLVGGKPENEGDPVCNYTKAQWHSLMCLVTDLTRRYKDAKVIGHNEVSDKTCPQFDAKVWWYG